MPDYRPGTFVRVCQHFSCWEAQDADSKRFDFRISTRVVPWTIAHLMNETVDFDRDPLLRAEKIEHVTAKGVLSAKPHS